MIRPSAILLLVALAACQRPAEPKVADAWVRLAAAPGRPAAAYFTLTGGPADWTLTGVATPAAGRVELHETMRTGTGGGGMAMAMRPIGQVALPAGGKVDFVPGGKHVMLFDVKAGVKPGDTVPLTLRFANGRTLATDAKAVAAGDAPPT